MTRRVISVVLAGLSALVLVLAAAAAWTSRTALDTTRFVTQVGPVIDQEPVRTAVASEISRQVVALVGTPLAAPLVDAATAQVVDSATFRALWFSALGAAHHQAVDILKGRDTGVQQVGGHVRVDLIAVVAEVLHRLPPDAVALLGRSGQLDVPPGATAAELRATVSRYLGSTLPATFATVPIARTTDLERARSGVRLVDGSSLLLLLVATALFVAALVVSGRAGRTTVHLGLWLVVLTVAGYVGALGLRTALSAVLPGGTAKPVTEAIMQALFASLRTPVVLLALAGVALTAIGALARMARIRRASAQ